MINSSLDLQRLLIDALKQRLEFDKEVYFWSNNKYYAIEKITGQLSGLIKLRIWDTDDHSKFEVIE
jgi:hypothetical protein